MIVDKIITIASIVQGIAGIIYDMLNKDNPELDPVKRVVEILGPFDKEHSEQAMMDIENLKFIAKMEERYKQKAANTSPSNSSER